MESSPSTERRRFSRIGFDADAIIIQGEQRQSVQVLDISIKGVLAGVEAPEQINTAPATLLIVLENASLIEMQITLVRRHEQYLGFRCDSIDIDSAAHLRRLMELNLNIPNAAERVLEELVEGNHG